MNGPLGGKKPDLMASLARLLGEWRMKEKGGRCSTAVVVCDLFAKLPGKHRVVIEVGRAR